ASCESPRSRLLMNLSLWIASRLTFLSPPPSLHAAGSGLYCDASIDGIGTCWPRSSAGHMVARPCPEMFYGVRYNTTSKCQIQISSHPPSGNILFISLFTKKLA
uniref:G-protein coupled receptors family 2 profile 1 domain-containing protein n=1 Tax=Mola mola TaxID=94237 RepID=A0A3Q3W4H2_MOLML